jgi:hypothetical protein
MFAALSIGKDLLNDAAMHNRCGKCPPTYATENGWKPFNERHKSGQRAMIFNESAF